MDSAEMYDVISRHLRAEGSGDVEGAKSCIDSRPITR